MKGGVMDANVTVEEMVAAIGFAARVGTTEPPRRLLAAQQYIFAAQSQIAEAMSILSPSMPESGLVDACRQVKQAAISEAGNARKLEALLAERDAQIARMFADYQAAADDAAREIAEMRKVTGPPCSKCGHWLNGEHGRSFNPPTRKTHYYCKHKDGQGDRCECYFPVAELGLEANDGNP